MTPEYPAQRLAALRETGLLDSPPEAAYDRLTAFASKVLKVPIALMSLVDEDRQFLKSQFGVTEPLATTRQTPLSHSFCRYVTASGSPFIVQDSRIHPLVRNNPAVDASNVIAYAGVPLTDANGFALGALCAIDSQPRNWTDDEMGILQTLAAQVMSEIQLRSHTRRVQREFESLQALEADREIMTQLTVHDLRTPLTALSMSLQMLPQLGPLNAAQLSSLTLLHRVNDIMQKIVNDVLDIGRVEQEGGAALSVEECAPADLVARATELTRPLAAERNMRIESWVPDGTPKVNVDREKMVRVLVNLIANAVKYSSRGSRIMILVEERADRKDQLNFSVTDTGMGIAPEDQKRIFQRGVRLDATAPTSRSAGLGLTFCQRIVDAHGGNIWVESQPGEGSTFFISLPISPE